MFKTNENCSCSKIAGVLVIVGAINWGLVGLGSFLKINLNLVNLIFGRISWLEEIIYVLVGIAGLVLIFGCQCKLCKPGEEKPSGNN